MTFLYDPKTRKVHTWVVMSFIGVPFLIIVIGWLSTRKAVEREKNQISTEKETDIFDKF